MGRFVAHCHLFCLTSSRFWSMVNVRASPPFKAIDNNNNNNQNTHIQLYFRKSDFV